MVLSTSSAGTEARALKSGSLARASSKSKSQLWVQQYQAKNSADSRAVGRRFSGSWEGTCTVKGVGRSYAPKRGNPVPQRRPETQEKGLNPGVNIICFQCG